MSIEAMKQALESCAAFLLSAGFESSDAYAEVCAAIEQAEKQEPVALSVVRGEICYKSDNDDQSYGMWCPVNYDTQHGFPDGTNFYTAPPQREWVELTDEEIEIASESRTGCEKYVWVKRVIRNAEAKLKEKNHVS